MICSLFNFCPQSAQSRRHGWALVGLATQTKLQAPNWNVKHYKSVELLSVFRMSSAPAQTQSPPIENVLATALSLLIHLLPTRRQSYPNETRVVILTCVVAWPAQKFGWVKMFDFRRATKFCL